jgi:hypothetical protein
VSCQSVVKPQLKAIEVNNRLAIETIIEVENEVQTVQEVVNEIEIIIDNDKTIQEDTKQLVKDKIKRIVIETEKIEVRLETAKESIKQNEPILKNIEKETKPRSKVFTLVIILIIVIIIAGCIIIKFIF